MLRCFQGFESECLSLSYIVNMNMKLEYSEKGLVGNS